MAKQDNKKASFDVLPLHTIVEVVKLDQKGNFIGKKDMEYGQWKDFKRQSGYIYRCFQKKFSQFEIK